MDSHGIVDPSEEAMQLSALSCPLCGRRLVERHCKRLCENCGYVESCEDLFGPPAGPPSVATPDELS